MSLGQFTLKYIFYIFINYGFYAYKKVSISSCTMIVLTVKHQPKGNETRGSLLHMYIGVRHKS